MPTYTFTGPSRTARRNGKCPGCGKPAKRSRTFEQTVNPFNKNADGTVKTPREVAADVEAQAAAWDPPAELFECQACERDRTAPEPGTVEPFPADHVEKAAARRARSRRWLDWVDTTGLPLTEPRWGYRDDADLLMWDRDVVAVLRAAGIGSVKIRREDGDLKVSARTTLPDVGCDLTVRCSVPAGNRVRPTGESITVDELAAFITETGRPQRVVGGAR